LTGKARIFSSSDETDIIRSIDEQYSLGRSNDNITAGLQFGAQEGFTPIQQTGLLDTTKVLVRGSQMAGPLGFGLQLSSLNVGTDTLDIARNVAGTPYAQPSVYVTPILSAGSTSDLVTILGQKFNGQLLVLNGTIGNTITIKNTVAATQDTITTPGGTDFVLSGVDNVQLIFDETAGKWHIISGGAGGGGGITFPITPPVSVRGNVNTNQDINLSTTVAHSTTMTLTGDIDITFSNIPSAATQIEWEIEITQDGTGGHVINNWPAGTTPIPVFDIDAGATSIVILRVNDGGTIIRTLLAPNTTADASQWATFTAVTDVDVGTFDILNIDRAIFVNDSGSITANNVTQMLLNSSGSFQTNTDTGNDFVWTILNDTILTIQEDLSNNSVLTLQSLDDTGGSVMKLFRNDIDGGVPSPLVIGSYGFQTGTTVASTVGDYASIQGVAEDVTSGAIEGSLDLLAADGGGGQSIFISINDGSNNLVDIFKDLDMNTNDILAGGAGQGVLNIGHLDFIDNLATPAASISLFSDGIDLFANTGGGTVNLSDISAGVGANTALSNLDLTTAINSNEFRPATNGTQNLGGPSNRWANIHGGRMIFPTGTSSNASEANIVKNTTNDMQFNVTTGNTFDWTFQGGSVQMELSSTLLSLPGVDIDLENNNIFDIDQVQITGPTGDVIHGFISGQTGSLDITSNANSSSVRIFARDGAAAIQEVATFNAVTPSVDLHDATLFDVNLLNFSVPSGVSPSIFSLTNDLIMVVGAGNQFQFDEPSGTRVLDIDSVGLHLYNGNGVSVGRIGGLDLTTDVLEIRLDTTTDFFITDAGTTRAEFNNTLLRWRFDGSSLFVLPQETQISDRASAPSTPSSGFMSLYVINVAGVQTFRVKFDNGTEKTIATDV